MRIRRLVLVIAGVLLFTAGAFAQNYDASRSYGNDRYSHYRRDDRHERRHHRRHERREHKRHHHRDNYRHDGYRR